MNLGAEMTVEESINLQVLHWATPQGKVPLSGDDLVTFNFLVLTFHPFNFKVREIIRKNFHILKNDPETSFIFSNNPFIVTYTRNRHHLVVLFLVE